MDFDERKLRIEKKYAGQIAKALGLRVVFSKSRGKIYLARGQTRIAVYAWVKGKGSAGIEIYVARNHRGEILASRDRKLVMPWPFHDDHLPQIKKFVDNNV